MPWVLGLKEKGAEVLLFKGGLKEKWHSQTCCGEATVFESAVFAERLSLLFSTLVNDISVSWSNLSTVTVLLSANIDSPLCRHLLYRCMLIVTGNVHNTHHCIKCLLCGVLHRCVPALARWVICTACHTTECRWQRKYCTRAATHVYVPIVKWSGSIHKLTDKVHLY